MQYFCDCDYKSELLRYQAETERFTNIWTRRARNERFTDTGRPWGERKLRRQRVVLYVTRALESVPKAFQSAAARREYHGSSWISSRRSSNMSTALLEIFGSSGTRVMPMNDLDHYRHFTRFLNPSLNDRFDFDPAEGFSRTRFRRTAGIARETGRATLDSPRWTLPLADCADPVAADQLSRNHPAAHESAAPRLHHHGQRGPAARDPRDLAGGEGARPGGGDYASEKKISLLTVMEKKARKIHALMQGQTIPFHAPVRDSGLGQDPGRPEREGRGDQERGELDERRPVF